MKRSRTITIGMARTPWFVRIGNCGFPGGFYMHWRGRVHTVFQQSEFVDWRDVVTAIRSRLRMARLLLVGEPVRCVSEYWERIQVRVERACPARATGGTKS